MQVIYVARNPKDMVVSYFNHLKTLKLQGFDSDFATLFEYFIKGQGMTKCTAFVVIFVAKCSAIRQQYEGNACT